MYSKFEVDGTFFHSFVFHPCYVFKPFPPVQTPKQTLEVSFGPIMLATTLNSSGGRLMGGFLLINRLWM